MSRRLLSLMLAAMITAAQVGGVLGRPGPQFAVDAVRPPGFRAQRRAGEQATLPADDFGGCGRRAVLTRTGIVAVVAAIRAIGTTMCLMIPPVQGHCQPGMIV